MFLVLCRKRQDLHMILMLLRVHSKILVQQQRKHIKSELQSRPSTTRLVIRRIGCNAVDRASRFFYHQGEYVEIMVNNVTVILVVRDTCKINTTSTSTYSTRTEMSEGITIARVYFGCGIVSTVDRLTTPHDITSVCHKECSLGWPSTQWFVYLTELTVTLWQ